VTDGETIAINLGGGRTVEWYVKASGPETFVYPAYSGNSFSFAAPKKPGFFNVTVIATVSTVAGNIDYAG
jgi:hypothetical protein